MRTLTLVTALAALSSTAAAAQRRPQPAPAQQPAPAPQAAARDSAFPGLMGRGMEAGALAGWLASNPSELNLSPDQLSRIRAARDEVAQANTPLRAQLRSVLENRDWRSMAPADRRALADSTRGIREQLRANVERGRTAVAGILTPAQQQTLDRTRPRWRTGGPGPAMRSGRGGRMMMRQGMGPAGWGRPARPLGPAMRIGYRSGWRAGWRDGMRAERRSWRRFGPI